MVHRALVGSFERFLGILIEHYAGAFPAWLAPVQVVLLTISDQVTEYAKKVLEQLRGQGFRAEWDNRNEKLGLKIREAQLKKIPYMLIIGDKEVQENKLAVRARKDGDLGKLSLEDFIKKLQMEVSNQTTNVSTR